MNDTLVIPDISPRTVAFLKEKGLLTEKNGNFIFNAKKVYCLEPLYQFSTTEYFKCLISEEYCSKMRKAGVIFTNDFLSQFVGEISFMSVHCKTGEFIMKYPGISFDVDNVFEILANSGKQVCENIYAVSQLLYFNYADRSLEYPIFREFEEFLQDPSVESVETISEKYREYTVFKEDYLAVVSLGYNLGDYIKHYPMNNFNPESAIRVLSKCKPEVSENVYSLSKFLYNNYKERSSNSEYFEAFEAFLKRPTIKLAKSASETYSSFKQSLDVKSEAEKESLTLFYSDVPSFQFLKKSRNWNNKDEIIQFLLSKQDDFYGNAIDILFPLRYTNGNKNPKQFLYQLYKEYKNLFGNKKVTIFSKESLQDNLNGFIYKKKNFKVIFLGGQNPCINLDGRNICSCEEYDRSYFCMSENEQILMDINSYDLPRMRILQPQQYIRITEDDLLFGYKNDVENLMSDDNNEESSKLIPEQYESD